MNKLLYGVVIAAALLLVPKPALAANVDLTVSPVFYDYNPDPGQILKDKVRIHNNTSSPLPLTITVDSMGINDRGDVVPETLPSSEGAKWFSFTTTKFSVPPNEWYDLPFTLSVPPQASFGNYFAITISPTVTKTAGTNALVQGNVVIPVLINVQKAGTVAAANIESFKVGSFINEFLPVDFSVQVKNTGNIHIPPRGNIFIRGRGDKDMAILEVNPARGNILPNSSRTFTTSWTDGFIVRQPVLENGVAKLNSLGKPVTRLTVNWNKLTSFRIGKYTAYVLLAYDDGRRDVPIESSLTFWVFPYKAVAIGVGLVILLLVSGSAGIKAMVKREAKKLKT